ncbi:winged helix-turn-helix domain-containing protein [Planococcus shenhongbingii]|uniref:ArsR/SmtB family transcription factor n=1 Tax=Planococcus shenhongbingii TaxID=3058398 RepID=UPI0026120335|nr:winged helix-turn-helix domain-containing protein [Planococcus sp. N016]WKA60241.1 winged helix-turn-helix domain-containing protein [Planococcus sp. N016]
MKILNSVAPSETIQLKVEQSPVWELILGIAGYTHKQLRHTFERDEEWTTNKSLMPPSLVQLLKGIEETNFWYGMLLLQNQFAAASVPEFSNLLSAASTADFYEWLLPYHDRQSEALRKEAAREPGQTEVWEKYADLFNGHDYLEGYVHQLLLLSQSETSEMMIRVLTEWENWISQKEEWGKWLQALTFEQKEHRQLDARNAVAEIERVTGGVEYLPEPSVWSVKLIPQVSYRPWVLTIRTADTKLFFYPVKEEHLLEPGVPSNELIRGHKALGDELRLKLLFQLQKHPLSLQELSSQFNTSKTTLHHQLALLKAAKFIRVEKGIYSINPDKLEAFSSQLARYMRTSL